MIPGTQLSPMHAAVYTPKHIAVCTHSYIQADELVRSLINNNNNNNRRLVTLAEHTSDHGRQTNSSTEEKGEQV